jgi:transcription factor A, mitochondrial
VRAPTKTVEEKLGLPPRPKKPLTPYFRFLQTVRPAMVKENPNLKAIEVVQRCAQKWTETPDSTKAKLNEDYQKDKIAYIKSRSDYEKNLSDEQKENLKIVKRGIAEGKQRRIYRKVSWEGKVNERN